MTNIKKIEVIGDIVRVTFLDSGKVKVISRNVQGYPSMSEDAKNKTVADIIGAPVVDLSRRSIVDRILRRKY